eukprot:Awhi_evm1s3772
MNTSLPAILNSFPKEWKGTTFNNANLLGRETFSKNLKTLIDSKGGNITTEDLVDLGNAEDYLRVSSNISCVLEHTLASKLGYNISQVFTFSSSTMPIVAVLLTSPTPVHLYLNNNKAPFTSEQIDTLKMLGCQFEIHDSAPEAHPNDTVLSLGNAQGNVETFDRSVVDGSIETNTLYIHNSNKIKSSDILVIRKRMSTPLTTPAAEAQLQAIAGVPVTADTKSASEASLNDFYGHLQTLSGTKVDSSSYPVCFTAGLPAISSLWLSLIGNGGADILMASTAYGGSSQLTDLLTDRSSILHKHTFDITGKNDISVSIRKALDALAADPSSLMPITVLFVEIPTNPDMKVPDIAELSAMLANYEKTTNKEVVVLVDCTFAPGSKVLQQIEAAAPNLNSLAFISLSKSVSGGFTTGGTLVAGPSSGSAALLEKVRATATMLDTTAKNDQLLILADNHSGVEERCASAYQVACQVGEVLKQSVKTHCNNYDMDLAFPTPEQAAKGFTSSTFSFNLPSVQSGSEKVNEGLAQVFVDLLVVHPEFKPCVSFGQNNTLVYATVPATSTQGAIKEEHKAKQAVGGVQLVRLSFPPSCDVDAVSKIIEAS